MSTAVAEQPPERREPGLAWRIPILGWLPQYDRRLLSKDAVAGTTVTVIVVPEGVAYAELALLAGLLFVLFGLLKLGFIARFFSESVLKGFVFGLAMVIAIGQAAKLFGLERPEVNFFEKAWQIISQLGQTNPWALFLGTTSLALLFGIERFARRVSAALVALVYGIGLVSILGLGDRLPIVGAIVIHAVWGLFGVAAQIGESKIHVRVEDGLRALEAA
jgi:MFS superfamily sulfate permease-like transporter